MNWGSKSHVQICYLLTDTRTLSLGYRRLKSGHRGLKISATELNSASPY